MKIFFLLLLLKGTLLDGGFEVLFQYLLFDSRL
jgi:hypothetical protein